MIGYLIISGGMNIYPREVEETLLRHPDVAATSVVDRLDPEWGEVVAAGVQAGDLLVASHETALRSLACVERLVVASRESVALTPDRNGRCGYPPLHRLNIGCR